MAGGDELRHPGLSFARTIAHNTAVFRVMLSAGHGNLLACKKVRTP